MHGSRRGRRVLAAVTVAVSLVAANADAAVTAVTAIAYRTVAGTALQEDPMARVLNDDGSHLTIVAKGRRTERVAYQMTFDGFIGNGFSMRFAGHAEGVGCALKPFAFDWERGKFVWLRSTFFLDDSPSEVTAINTLSDAQRYLRNGTAKIRYSCAGKDPFILRIDQTRMDDA